MIVAPSILSADFSNLLKEVKEVQKMVPNSYILM